MAFEIGQFNSDGSRKVVELIDGNPEKPRFVATSGWERELFQLRKNPAYLLADQDVGIRQPITGILTVPLGTTTVNYPDDILPTDIPVFQEALFDLRATVIMHATMALAPAVADDFTSLQGRRLKPGRINQLSIPFGDTVFALTGQPTAARHWARISLASASLTKEPWAIMWRPGTAIDYQAPLVHPVGNPRYGEGFSPIVHSRPIGTASTINPHPDLYIGSASQYIRAIRVSQMTSGLWLFRIAFYLGLSNPTYQFSVEPLALDETLTPEFVRDANNFLTWNSTPGLVGGRIMGRIVADATDALNFADTDVIDALVKDSKQAVTSGAVADATRALTTEVIASKNAAAEARDRVDSLFAKKGTQVRVGEATFFAGKQWTNNTAALIALDLTTDPTEAHGSGLDAFGWRRRRVSRHSAFDNRSDGRCGGGGQDARHLAARG
jgi:hypothetical protein